MAHKGFFSWFKRNNEVSKEQVSEGQQEEVLTKNDVVAISDDVKDITTSDDIIQDNADNNEKSTDEKPVVEIKEAEPPAKTNVACNDISMELSKAQGSAKANNNAHENVDKHTVASSTADVLKSTDIEVQEQVELPRERPGFFRKLMQGLKRTRQNIGLGLKSLFKGRKIDDDLFEDLETALLTADVGFDTTTKLMTKLTKEASLRELSDADSLSERLSLELHEILKPVSVPLKIDISKKPFVILMVGVNGVGKTTTIGKMASLFKQQGLKVMLAAGDTFRAAAVEQLKVWGQRTQIPVVAQATGADSASVIYDAFNSAKAKGYDVLIADTAGRLQNKANLMEELRKIVRVMKKIDPSAPHEVMLTLDAGTGQNAISQARLFSEVVPITGVNITKLDGTAKGGVIFNIADNFKLPIRYIGIGEGIEDLREFDADDFINALFSEEAE